MEMITLKRGNETKQVSRLQWINMKSGNTFGWEELIETPAELLQTPSAPSKPQGESGEGAANVEAEQSSTEQEVSVDDQIAALEEQKKAEGLTAQQKANLTKQINELKKKKESNDNPQK